MSFTLLTSLAYIGLAETAAAASDGSDGWVFNIREKTDKQSQGQGIKNTGVAGEGRLKTPGLK